MAAVGDCFSIGSTLSCTTCFDQTLEGEVVAFDYQTKMLILILQECPPKTAENLSDVYILNLQFCSDVQVKKECSSTTEAPPPVNINQLKIRVRNAVEKRKRWFSAIASDVSPVGQTLYLALSKTVEQVTLCGQNIVIFNEVTVAPPYTIHNITTENPENISSFNYVKKMVEKYNPLDNGTSSQTSTTVGTSSSNSVSSVSAI